LFLIFADFAMYRHQSYSGFHKTRAERVWNQIFTNQKEPEMAAPESHYCH